MTDGAFDLGPLLPTVVLVLVAIIPTLRLLKRVGMSRAWALFTLFPVLGLIVVVWIIAFVPWKRTPERP